MSAIFFTTSQALHFSYLIQAYEAAPESLLARIVRQHVEQCDVWEPRRPKTIDFSGLNALEIRAECANVRAHVKRLLPPLEHAVVLARYGLTDYEDEGGQRRFFFDRERNGAVMYLSEKWAQPQFAELDKRVLFVLITRHYAHKKTMPITLRQIADTFGRNHTFYGRIAHKLTAKLTAIENRALDTLDDVFKAQHHGHSIA